jgi:hypothetical protein
MRGVFPLASRANSFGLDSYPNGLTYVHIYVCGATQQRRTHELGMGGFVYVYAFVRSFKLIHWTCVLSVVYIYVWLDASLIRRAIVDMLSSNAACVRYYYSDY